MTNQLQTLAKGVWIAIRRSRKDRRARRLLFVTVAALAYLLYAISYLIWMAFYIPANSTPGTPRAMLLMLVVAFLGMLIVIYRSTHNKPVDLGEALRTPARPQAGVPDGVRKYLAERAVITSALAARATAEYKLRSGRPAAARGVQNAILRETGLWETLDSQERELLGMPEGTWSLELCVTGMTWWERVRLLRWVLGVDAAMVPLAHFPGPDPEIALAAVPNAGSAREAWEVRVERDLAAGYLNRVLVELHHRRMLQTPVAQNEAVRAEEFRDRIKGQSQDLLAGTKTVGDLDDGSLQTFCRIVAARHEFAAYLVDILGSEQPVSVFEWQARRLSAEAAGSNPN